MLYLNIILLIFIFILTCIFVYFRWEKLCRIQKEKPDFFRFLFIIIYPFEELLFILLYNLDPELKGMWVSSILIIILATVVLDKTLLEKRLNYKKSKKEELTADVISKKDKDITDLLRELEKKDLKSAQLVRERFLARCQSLRIYLVSQT